MAFFKKQRKKYQEWLNSFVVKHHDEWYMPLITIGLGLVYTVIGLLLFIITALFASGLTALFGWVWAGVAAILFGLWGVGMFVRIPGDSAYDRKNRGW